jgi:hypothetical protein
MKYEKGIELPIQKRKENSFYSLAKKMINEMDVMDSIYIPFSEGAKGIANSLGQLKYRGKCNFTYRTELQGFRFWKVS